MDFSKIKSLLIPQGKVKSLSIGGVKVWSEYIQSSSGSEGLKYELTTTSGETYYVCTGFPYGKEVEDVVVASEIDGIPVKAIGYEAFYNDNIKSVTLPDSVTHTYARAFRGCTSLERIVGKGLESIGVGAFWDCSALAVVEISSKLKGIEGDSFRNCISLTEFNIPISVTWVGSYSFSGCTNLTIYCEAESQPSGWSEDWNYDLTNSTYIDVVWGSNEEPEEPAPEEDPLKGLWLWQYQVRNSTFSSSILYYFNFTSNNISYNSLSISSQKLYYGNTQVAVYDDVSETLSWTNKNYRTIEILDEITAVENGYDLLDVLKSNAKKPIEGLYFWNAHIPYPPYGEEVVFYSNGLVYTEMGDISGDGQLEYDGTVACSPSTNTTIWKNNSYRYVYFATQQEISFDLFDYIIHNTQKIEDPLKNKTFLFNQEQFTNIIGLYNLYTVKFMSNGELYNSINVDIYGSNYHLLYDKLRVCDGDNWLSQNYRTITVLSQITSIENGADLLKMLSDKNISTKQETAPEYQFTLFEVGQDNYGQITTCTFRQGMTWQEWVDSDYNTTNIEIGSNGFVYGGNGYTIKLNSTDVKSTDYVQATQYEWNHGEHVGGSN